MTSFELSYQERSALEIFLRRPRHGRQLRRAQALLWLDEGDTVAEVADRLHTSRQTIYNWTSQFEARYSWDMAARLSDGARRGRRCTAQGIIDPLIDAVIEKDPHKLGYRSPVWTAPLLKLYLERAHKIEVSRQSVSLALARLQVRWKRPRYRLARRPQTWRQAKGGSSAGSGRGSARSS
jgi:transposase